MADGNSRYKDLPRPESISFFENSIKQHKKVLSIKKIEEQKYKIIKDKSEINTYLTNLYIVGIADVHSIIANFPEVNCIITISNWNSYSNEAKEFCKLSKIGLFKYKELYGALYYDNKRFYNYEPPE